MHTRDGLLRALGCALPLLLCGGGAAQTAVWRLDCGGPGGPAPYGHPFTADVAYSPASHAGYVGEHVDAVEHPSVDLGPYDDPFRKQNQTARTGWVAYRFDVANGSYVLRLHFAEVDPDIQGPGLREFDLSVEDVPVLPDLDVTELLGLRQAGEFALPVTVTDGRLDVTIGPGGDPALLNAVEVWRQPVAPAPPAAVTGLVAKDGFGNTLLAWDPPLDPMLGAFSVEAAPAASGPWAPLALTWPAPARWIDHTAPVGVTRWYRVRGLNHLGQPGPASLPVSAVAHAPEESPLRVFELTLSPEVWKELNQLVLVDPDEEVPATFGHAGATWEVQVRYRGGGSLLLSKKSWKVKFADETPFEGRTELTLKAHFLDESLLHESLAGRLFAPLRHAAPDRQFVQLRVNGENLGVFEDFEQLDTLYLLAHGRDPGGSIYKADQGIANLGLLPSLADYQASYEKKTNEGIGHDDLIAFIEALADPATTPRELADLIDLDDYLDYLSVVNWLGDADQILRNYYLLHDHALGRWEWISWDNDRTFFDTAALIDNGTATCGFCLGVNVLKDRVLAVPAFRWRYCEKLKALMAGGASQAALDADIAQLHAQILADALADVHKQGWLDDALFLGSAAVLSDWVAPRSAFVQVAVASYQPPTPPTAVWLNELLAFSGDEPGGVAGALDEAGDADDWVELVNLSAAPADLGGAWLTDEISDPTRWAFPPGTVLAPGARLLVWCDGEPAEGPLHASFTLDTQGGELALIAADGDTLLDVYDWRPQQPGVAEGRLPDGGAVWQPLPQPSPLAANGGAGNLPPVVTWVQHVPAQPGSADAVEVSAQVKDGDAPLAVTLHWQANGGGSSTVPMPPIGNARYAATLPAMPAGSSVGYWIEAHDGAGGASLDPPAAPGELHGWLVHDPPPEGLRINEFMADNGGVLADEAGDFEDWIELHNGGAQTADLSGFHLTDNLAQPLKWTFPAGTLLPAGGRLLVWCDEEPSEGPLHAAIKLSKDGEAIGLSDAAGVLVDGFTFGVQVKNISQGLLPDGAEVPGDAPRVSFLDATPGAGNVPLPGGSLRFDADAPALTKVGLTATTPPLLGGSLSFTVLGGAANAAAILVPGFSPLQVGLGADGVLLVWPSIELGVFFSTDAAGQAAPAFTLPAKTALAGLVVEWQVFVLGAGLSNGVVTTLGP